MAAAAKEGPPGADVRTCGAEPRFWTVGYGVLGDHERSASLESL